MFTGCSKSDSLIQVQSIIRNEINYIFLGVTKQNLVGYPRTGVGKLRPAGRMRPPTLVETSINLIYYDRGSHVEKSATQFLV